MDSDIEFLEHIFDQMKGASLMETKAEFSQMLLGKGASYLTSMSARERNVPMEVLDHMSLRLVDRAEQANTVIGAMEARLCQALAMASREADIRKEFEAHRRRRLSAELTGFDDMETIDIGAPTTSRFVAMVLRKIGFIKGSTSAHAPAHGSTLH